MKINKSFKIEGITSSEDNREVLKSIYVYKENDDCFAVATNGKALAIVPVEIEDNELNNGNSVTASDLKFQRSNPAIKKQDYVFSFLKPLDGQFPDIKNVFPKTDPSVNFNVNVKLLKTLCDAMGSEIVSISVFEDKLLVNSTVNKSKGLICLCRK